MEQALTKMLSSSAHMSPEMSKKTKHVADDVRKAIAAVEQSANLTKAQRQSKIGAALAELAGLRTDFQEATQVTAESKQQKLEELKKELAEKKKLLEQDEAAIKLYTLQKELAEKKLELQKLIEKKNAAANSKKAAAEDASQEGALANKLMKLTDDLSKTKANDKLDASLSAALSEVQNRSKVESKALAQMDAVNKKTMAELDAELKKSTSSKGKAQGMIRGLKKQEHREYMKARVQKQKQVTELKDLEESIQKRDAKKFKATLSKMQHDAKALEARSGEFLH